MSDMSDKCLIKRGETGIGAYYELKGLIGFKVGSINE